MLSDIDKKILDTIVNEHEFESMIVESEEIQSSLSQKMALISHKLTAQLSLLALQLLQIPTPPPPRFQKQFK